MAGRSVSNKIVNQEIRKPSFQSNMLSFLGFTIILLQLRDSFRQRRLHGLRPTSLRRLKATTNRLEKRNGRLVKRCSMPKAMEKESTQRWWSLKARWDLSHESISSFSVTNQRTKQRVGGEGRRLMHLVPAPAVRLMKRRVQSRPGARQENRFRLAAVVWRVGHKVVFSFRVLTLVSAGRP